MQKKVDMKKLMSLCILTLLFTANTFAQKGAVSAADYELTAEKPNLEKAKEKIEEAVLNEKSMNWPKTYIVRSKVFAALYKESKKKNENSPKSEFVYEAYESLLKAEELDKKGDEKGKGIDRFKEEIGKEFFLLRIEMLNDGVIAYNRKDYTNAVKSFGYVLDIDKSDAYIAKSGGEANIDTAVMFNTAISAYYDKQHERAIELLLQVSELGYAGETPFLMLYTEYRDIQDTVNMVKTLKEGFEKYPENEVFIKDLVVYYINNNLVGEGMEYIDKALARDPNNTGFWFAKGTFLDKQKKYDEALKCYNEVLQKAKKEDDIYNANYNVGVIYYNLAVEKFDEANKIQDYAKYKEATAVAYEAMKKTLPYFEECHRIKPDDKGTLNTLSSVYYRLSKDDPEMNKKYAETKKLLDSM